MHVAVEQNMIKIVKRLIKAGANVNAADLNGNTPLHLSVKLGNQDIIIEILAVEGVNLSKKN